MRVICESCSALFGIGLVWGWVEPRQAAIRGGMPWCLDSYTGGSFLVIEYQAGPWIFWIEGSEGRKGDKEEFVRLQRALSDACAGEGSVLGEDDDASLAGDVAFH